MGIVAAILAGGKGARLSSVMDDRPKCLAEISGLPFIAYQLARLRSHGVEDVVFLTGWHSEQVEAYVGDGDAFGVRARYSREPKPLGTAGALKHAEAMFTEPFLLMNGDTMSDVDMATLHAAHQGVLVTLALCTMQNARDYGTVRVDDNGAVCAFEEKRPESRPGLVNAGVYAVSPDIFAHIPPDSAYSMETDLLPALLASGEPVQGFQYDGVFVDIGTPERLAYAQTHPLFCIEER